MQPRQDVTEQFSTFLHFAGDRARGWTTDARLRRSMQTRLTETGSQGSSEAFWAIYWHRQWLGQPENAIAPLSQGHLSAYLQEAAYWAAQRLSQAECPLVDCFQMAIEKVPKVLRACNPDHRVSLSTYSRVAFENIIRDALRQYHQVNLCNDWALLLRVSRKQLQEALQQAGLEEGAIARYLAACQSYEAGYQLLKSANRQRIGRPDGDGWATLVQCYAQQCPEASAINAATLEQWLLDCAKQVRAYLSPTLLSLNAPRSEESGDWQDELAGPQESPLTSLMEQEAWTLRQEQRSQLNDTLSTALEQLEPQAQELIHRYYQQGLTQQQIAQQTGLPQYTVSRRLAKAREKLLLALGHWSQTTLHKSPTSAVMDSMSALLEEWLYHHTPCAESTSAHVTH